MYITQGFEWATHQPLIRAVLALYDPKFVLELGAGMYSTPLFIGREFMCIENDIEWVNYIKETLGVEVIYHNLEEIHSISPGCAGYCARAFHAAAARAQRPFVQGGQLVWQRGRRSRLARRWSAAFRGSMIWRASSARTIGITSGRFSRSGSGLSTPRGSFSRPARTLEPDMAFRHGRSRLCALR